MYRIDNATALPTIPTPAAVGPNPDGFFYRGSPSLATPATIVDDDWCNSIQEELAQTIEAAGITLSKTSYVQLKLAIDYFAQKNGAVYASSSSAANTYVTTLTPAPLAYTTGMGLLVKFTNHNTGAATINVNTLGVKSMVRPDGSALQSGDIQDSMIAYLVYDGTSFQVVNLQAVRPIHIQNNSFVYCVDSGSANSLTATLSPAPTAYTAGFGLLVKIAANNTGATVINVNGLGSKNIKTLELSALPANSLVANMIAELFYDGTQFQLRNPIRRTAQTATMYTSNADYTVPAGVYRLFVEGWGAGASGGSSTDGAINGGGGGAGAYAADYVDCKPGDVFAMVIGTPGTPIGMNTTNDGNDGTATTFGSTLVVAAGGKKGLGGATGAQGGLGGLASDCTGSIKLSGEGGWGTQSSSYFQAGLGGSSPRNAPTRHGATAGFDGWSAPANSGGGGQGAHKFGNGGTPGAGLIIVTTL